MAKNIWELDCGLILGRDMLKNKFTIARFSNICRRCFIKFATKFILLFTFVSAQADIILVSPDTIYVKDNNLIQQHRALAKKVSELIGVNATFKQVDSWPVVSKLVLGEEFDILIAPAHIAAYTAELSNNLFMHYIGKFDGSVTYHLVVNADSRFTKTNDLLTSTICVETENKLSRNLVMLPFVNPVLQPKLIEIELDKAVASLDTRCDAVTMEDAKYQHYNSTHDKKLRSIHTTATAPNAAMMTSTKLRTEYREKLSLYFNSPQFAADFPLLFEYYAINGGKQILPIKDAMLEYGKFNLLPGVAWGW